MTGLGEDVYEDRTTALDALTAENERLGIYGAETDASGSEAEDDAAFDMRLRAMRAIQCAFAEANGQSISAMKIARSALLSIGLPLPDLQWAAENAAVVRALRSGQLRAVRVIQVTLPSGRKGSIPNVGDVFAAPKSPSEEV